MKRFVSLFLSLFLLMSPLCIGTTGAGSASIMTGTCGPEAEWKYDLTTHVLTVYGNGEIYDYSYKSTPWSEFSEFVYCVEIEEGITEIGNYSFSSFINARKITLPESLRSIGDRAFFDCSKCLEINIPKNVTNIGESAFKYCDSIVTVTLPDGLKEVKAGTFAACVSLERVIMYPSLEKIGYSAFSGFNLKNLSFLGTEEQWNSVIIEAKNFDLTDAPRNYCKNLSEVEPLIISGSAGESINWALNYDMKELTLSGKGSVGEHGFPPYEIESSAEWGKYFAITETAVVEEGITDLGILSFYNFASLKEIRLPASLESIGVNVFLGCTALSDVYYTGSETERENVLTIDPTNESVLNALWHYSASPLKDGDINGDGKVNSKDVSVIRRIIVNKASPEDFPGSADMNSDGRISGIDVLLLKKRILGI